MSKSPRDSIRESGLELTITDLIDKGTLQALQDQFTDKYRVPTGILDANADPITFERRHHPYCQEIRSTQTGYGICRQSDRLLIDAVYRTGRPRWRICEHGGLLDFAAPLRIDGKIAAYFFIGQIRGQIGTKKTDGLSERIQTLQSCAKRSGEESRVRKTSLRRKFLRIPRRTEKEIKEIEKAAIDFARELSHVLNKLRKWRQPQVVSQFVARIAQAGDLETLFDLCVQKIPQLLGTKDCSIFTVLYSKSRAVPRLVLRKTTFAPSRHLNDSASYKMGQGLTGWVWKNRRALRLKDIRDKPELAMYPGLKWTQTVNDSDEHKEWLGVPLLGWRNDVIGVIRVPQKQRTGKAGGGGFDFKDEVLLTTLGQHIARQVEELRIKERVGTSLRACQECAVQLSRVTSSDSVAKVVVHACEQIFGKTGRAIYFNLPTRDGSALRMEDVGGSLTTGCLRGMEFPLEHSLSGICLRRGKPMIIHNLERAIKKHKYFPAVEGLECAMSAPIAFAEKEFGALSVCADRRYEFSEEPDLHILRDLASIAGAALARLEAQREVEQGFIEFSSRAGHVLYTRIATLESAIAAMKKASTDGKRAPGIVALQNAVEFLKSAADLAVSFGRSWEHRSFQRFGLATRLKELKGIYEPRPVSWSVRGALEMLGDPDLIEHMVVELIENALRFSKKGAGAVSVRAFRRKIRRDRLHAQPAVVIEVGDKGPGIPRDMKESIFYPYKTSDPSRLGLGLSIVKSVAEAHGGYVEERGKPGRGSCFRVVIPQ